MARWREVYMRELLDEVEDQAEYLIASDTGNPQEPTDLQRSPFEGTEHGNTAV
jgi:hypothetical protein